MAGLVSPSTRLFEMVEKTWMPGTRLGMTG
jgi:hypothetical protein